jgi:ubiquinol-cytochrome c reductase iron-sulfur subunit
MDRRGFVKGCVLLGAGAAVGGLGVLSGQQMWQARGPTQEQAAPITWDDGRAVTVQDVDEATERFLQAIWRGQPVVVVKVAVAALQGAALLHNVNTGQHARRHPSDPTMAIVAYHGRCTHLGCTVGWAPELGASRAHDDYDGDGWKDGRILCPCHQAQFDVHDLATHQPGTPAPRPLGALRFRIEDGVLVGLQLLDQDRRHAADLEGPGAPFALASQ